MSFHREGYRGLATEEALYLRKLHGDNEVDKAQESSLLMKYFSHFKEPMISLLLLSGCGSVILNEIEDAISIFIAVFIVVSVAFIQEYKSDQSMAAITKLLPPMCTCFRDGKLVHMEASLLVPGDLVSFSTGDRVPADIKVIECSTGLKIDESNLTGEMKTISKASTDIENKFPEKYSTLFMGTLVRYGHGKGIVIATGFKTQFGLVYAHMKNELPPKSPLKLSMDQLGKQLTSYSLVIIVMIILFGIFKKRSIFSMLTMGVSLAVAAIPEGLPIVVTVTLALSVIKMAKRRAIIKKLHVVESLGCVTSFCADKTGTITLNEMSVTSIHTSDGAHYDLGIRSESAQTFDTIADLYNALPTNFCLKQLLKACCICNDARLSQESIIIGQPTEKALLSLGLKCGFLHDTLCIKRVDEMPFSSETKWMGVVVEDPEFLPDKVHYLKGAPEVIMSKCSSYFSQGKLCCMTDEYMEHMEGIVQELSLKGLRSLAIAYGLSPEEYVFLGVVMLVDPVRNNVTKVFRNLRNMGISCKILTGDSKETALSVAQSVGISDTVINLLSGEELNNTKANKINAIVNNTHVFYRITPIDKINIVKALRNCSHIVAMTGDGVNDSIALKAAHVGISMGKGASDVCKEAADVVLTDDNIECLLDAINEGKVIFRNIQNFVKFQISTSITTIMLISLSIFFNLRPPLNSIQILWINIIMDGPPAQSLGVEPSFTPELSVKPRAANQPIVDKNMLFSATYSSLIMVVSIFALHYYERKINNSKEHNTTITFTSFVFFDLFNALNCRSKDISIFKIGFFSNRPFLYSVAGSFFCQLLVLYFPLFSRLFQTTALTFKELISLILLASTVFIADEIRKFLRPYFIKRFLRFI